MLPYTPLATDPVSVTMPARWLQRAAGHGHIDAQTLLAGLCVHGLAGGVNGDRPNAYLPRRSRDTSIPV